MIAITTNTLRAAWLRIVFGLAVAPMSFALAVTAAGTGNFPLGAALVIAPLYLLGVVLLDLWSIVTRSYRARPKYLIGCFAAAVPTLGWLIWLTMAT